MSQGGKLCGAKIKISDNINSENTKTVSCDLWEGHEGDHSKMFYHCKEVAERPGFPDNHRLGRISWNNELTENKKANEGN